MKIATNVDRQMFGGISTTNLALFLSLERSGHTFVALEMPRERSIRGATVFWRFSPDFFVHRIIQVPDLWETFSASNLVTMERFRQHWALAVELTTQALKEHKPDIILLNGTGIAPWVLAEAGQRLKIPMVLRYAGLLTIETQMSRSSEARELFRALEKTFTPRVKHCIFPSAVAKRVVEEVVTGTSINNTSILPNPVFVPSTYRQHANRLPAIGAVGRWAKVKNFNDYFRLHRKLKKQRFRHRAFIVTNLEWAKGVPQTMEKIAPMSQEKLWQFYTHLNLIVVPSTFETFCNVAAEAMVTGTPVLVSETVGFSEVLHQFGLHGMVVPSFEDVDLVAARVKELVKQPIPFFKRRAIARHLEPNRVHRQLIEILENVVATGHRW